MHIYTVTCIIHTTVQLLVLKLRLISPGPWYTELHHGTRWGGGGGVGGGRWILSLPIIEATASPKQSHGAIRPKADPVSRVTLEWLIAHVWCNKILKWLRSLSDKIASFSYTRSSLSFFSVRRAKGATHENDHAHCWRRETREASRAATLVSRVTRLCCSRLAHACNPLTKSEHKREPETARSLIFHDSIVSQFRRELSTKKTKPNIEKWPESLGVMLEF